MGGVSGALSIERWERWLARLPFLVLAVATLVALAVATRHRGRGAAGEAGRPAGAGGPRGGVDVVVHGGAARAGARGGHGAALLRRSDRARRWR